MEGAEGSHLNEREKTLIAMAAAMGAGCGKCAEKLHRMGARLGIPAGDVRRAFEMGLNAKAEAVGTMRGAVSDLLQNEAVSGCGKTADRTAPGGDAKRAAKLECLIRLASYAASNSGRDAREGIEEALAQGADSREVKFCLSLAGRVRKQAVRFFEGFLEDDGKKAHGNKKPEGKEGAAGGAPEQRQSGDGPGAVGDCLCGCK